MECGSTEGVTRVLEGFSRLAAQVGNRRLAAVLLGASEHRTTGGGIQFDRVDRERLEADLQDRLGMERLEAAQAEGRAMSRDEAIELALAQKLDSF
jgi:hypothetical protein